MVTGDHVEHLNKFVIIILAIVEDNITATNATSNSDEFHFKLPHENWTEGVFASRFIYLYYMSEMHLILRLDLSQSMWCHIVYGIMRVNVVPSCCFTYIQWKNNKMIGIVWELHIMKCSDRNIYNAVKSDTSKWYHFFFWWQLCICIRCNFIMLVVREDEYTVHKKKT